MYGHLNGGKVTCREKKEFRNNFKEKLKLSLVWSSVEFGLLDMKGEIILGRRNRTNHRHGNKKEYSSHVFIEQTLSTLCCKVSVVWSLPLRALELCRQEKTSLGPLCLACARGLYMLSE